MPKENLDIVLTNFIKAMHYIIAEEELGSEAGFATWMGMSKQNIYNVTHGRRPSLDMIMTLCEKGGFNANWVLFNQGEPKIQEQNDIDKMMKELRAIKAKVSKLS